MIFNRVSDIVLDDIYLKLADAPSHVEVFLKLEALNCAGSIKLKTARHMVETAERRGLLLRGCSRIVESSSGNLGVALALLASERQYAFTCVVDPNVNDLAVDQIRAYGGDVLRVTEKDEAGGYLATRIQTVERLLREDSLAVWLNQYANPSNVEAHRTTTARSIFNQFPHLDYLFVGAGTCGTLMGCIEYIADRQLPTKVVAVDAFGSTTFGGSSAVRRIPGIGTSRRPEIVDVERVPDVMWITEGETVAACRRLVRTHGLLAGGSTGSVLAAILKRVGDMPQGAKVVGISPDFGGPYVDSIYCDSWVTKHDLQE